MILNSFGRLLIYAALALTGSFQSLTYINIRDTSNLGSFTRQLLISGSPAFLSFFENGGGSRGTVLNCSSLTDYLFNLTFPSPGSPANLEWPV